MSDQPKVSERMREHLNTYTAEIEKGATRDWSPGSLDIARRQLLSAIAEIEQRAERWKEAAVAEHRLRQFKFCSASVAAEAAKRVGLAIAALGDEWDEAVR